MIEELPHAQMMLLRLCLAYRHSRTGIVRRSLSNIATELEMNFSQARDHAADLVEQGLLERYGNGFQIPSALDLDDLKMSLDNALAEVYSRAHARAHARTCSHARSHARETTLVTARDVMGSTVPLSPAGRGETVPPITPSDVFRYRDDTPSVPKGKEGQSLRITRRRSRKKHSLPGRMAMTFRTAQQQVTIVAGAWSQHRPPNAGALVGYFAKLHKAGITEQEMTAMVIRFWADDRWWQANTAEPWKRFIANGEALLELVRDPRVSNPVVATPTSAVDWRSLAAEYLGLDLDNLEV